MRNVCLSVRNLYYFEDFIIHFDKIVIVENVMLEVNDYYIDAKIIKAKLYLPC